MCSLSAEVLSAVLPFRSAMVHVQGQIHSALEKRSCDHLAMVNEGVTPRGSSLRAGGALKRSSGEQLGDASGSSATGRAPA